MPRTMEEIQVQQSLKEASEKGDIKGLYSSIREAPDILDRIDEIPFVDTPLHTACSAGQTYFAAEIFSLKPSFGRKQNPDGLSPLHLALQNGHCETVKRLIKFDKELVRVKGKERLTPLHFAAKTDDLIDADQQRKDDRINLLAEFLFACPQSIEDLTVRDETALHIAVKDLNQSAVEVLLGFIRWTVNKRVLNSKDEKGNTAMHIAVSTSRPEMVKLLVKYFFLANQDEKNLNGHTALDIAKRLEPGVTRRTIDDLLRSVGEETNFCFKPFKGMETIMFHGLQLQNGETKPKSFYFWADQNGAGASESSRRDGDSSLAGFLKSPDRGLEGFFRTKFLVQREITMDLRNIVLVVAVLLATATFQAVVSPPGGGGGGDNNLLTNGSNINATVLSASNLSAVNTSHISATLFIPTDNPFDRILLKDAHGKGIKYGTVFICFYVMNTVAFIFSMGTIMFLLPVGVFLPLHISLVYVMGSYGTSFFLISPSYGCTLGFVCLTSFYTLMVYYLRFFPHKKQLEYRGDWPFSSMSYLRRKRLLMVERLMMNCIKYSTKDGP